MNSVTKRECREYIWPGVVKDQKCLRGRLCRVLWLARPDFSDVLLLKKYCGRALVLEGGNHSNAFARKKEWLDAHKEHGWIELQGKTVLDYAIENGNAAIPEQFDVANLDLCTHFHYMTCRSLDVIFGTRLINKDGVLFLTVSRACHAEGSHNPQHKVIATTLESIRDYVENLARSRQCILDLRFGKPYRSESGKEMFTYGWTVKYRGKNGRSIQVLSNREKSAIGTLLDYGLPAAPLAAAFGITIQQVAGYRAWATKRAQA